MKFFMNHLHNRLQNPNLTPAKLSESASGETASSSSSGERVDMEEEEEEEEEISYESAESEDDKFDDTASFEEERVDTASSSSNVVALSLRMEKPPTDDCCPICFGNFVVPCRGPCGHWYCGGCILQYWNYGAALQPCNCPLCSRKITNLTPEASLHDQQEAEVIEVLKKVMKYNRLFVSGTYGFILKLLGLPFYIRRVFNEMMNPDRPGAHLNKLRIFAMFMGLLYTLSPFDFFRIGRQNIIDVFDYSAIALSSVLYLVGLYLRRRRFRNVRDMAEMNFDAN